MKKEAVIIFSLFLLSMIAGSFILIDNYDKLTGMIVRVPLCVSTSDCPSGQACDLYFDDGKCKTPTNVNYQFCTDSDAGYIPNVKGTVTYKNANGAIQTATDLCLDNRVMEAVCDFNGYAYNGETFDCDNGCENGACISPIVENIPNVTNSNAANNNQNTGTVNASESTEIIVEETDKNFSCGGCKLANKCYPIGYRMEGNFCGDSEEFKSQVGADTSCENNFECYSNLCIDGKCTSNGLWQKILSWFKSLFG